MLFKVVKLCILVFMKYEMFELLNNNIVKQAPLYKLNSEM